MTELASIDADFNGDNGVVSKEAQEKEFGSDCAYSLDYLKDIEDDELLVENFIEDWIGHDTYYSDYNLHVLKNADGRVKAIALAVIGD